MSSQGAEASPVEIIRNVVIMLLNWRKTNAGYA